MTTQPAPAHEEKRTMDPGGIVLEWWRETIASPEAPSGPRAELRRVRSLEEVVFTPPYHDLRRRLRGTRWRNVDRLAVDRLALVAGTLAQVREHDPSRSFAAQMATTADGGGSRTRPRVAPSRFRRLLRLGDRAEDLEQLFQQIRRIIALLDHRANVTDLANNLYWWNPDTRKRWALDYYDHVDERALESE